MNVRRALLGACALALAGAAASVARGDVERYKTEGEFLARLAELGLTANVLEDFESSAWDGTRSTITDPHQQSPVVSMGITWEAATWDVWGNLGGGTPGLSTNRNWAQGPGFGVYTAYSGFLYPTTIRVSCESPMYAVGGWFNTNPDLESVGYLFEDATTANPPGYVLPGYGAMYPGDNPAVGHVFTGIIDPDGFNAVVLVGDLMVNEKGILEGGTIYGADNFMIVAPGLTPACPGDLNDDNIVDVDDLNIVLSGFGAPYTVDDLNLVLSNWQASCP